MTETTKEESGDYVSESDTITILEPDTERSDEGEHQKITCKREHLISVLHHIQDQEEFHYIPEEQIRKIADALHISPSEVYGVISFYSMFSAEPRGKYIVRVCSSAPCHIMGKDAVVDSVTEILGIEVGETTKDNLFTLELSSCLGLCDVAPTMMINDEIYSNLTRKKVHKIIEAKKHEYYE